MAIMVRKLYKNATFLYEMNLVAGKGGMSGLVQWVHIIEDVNVIGFLHGGELVFTAGIMNNGGDWLLRFAQKLKEAQASAFVVNLGPHTKEIAKEVYDYCNQVSLPLFTIPWETRMVDMTRDFCHRIMRNEHAEHNIVSIIKNILFKVGDMDQQVMQLERYGYQRGSRFCFVCVSAEGEGWQESSVERIAEATARRLHELFVSFSYKETRILVLVNYDTDEIDAFMRNFLALSKKEMPDLRLHVGVSSNQEGIYDQTQNFERSLSAMQMARRRGETAEYYDRLGFFKLLCAVEDKSVLRGFYQETVAPLEKYDRENKTELTGLLCTYIDLNANLIKVAKNRYVHRNTVANQLKKIKSVTGLDPLEQKDMLLLKTGLLIRDIL